MTTIVIRLQGKGDSKAEYVSVHSFGSEKDANSFIEVNTFSGKYWTTSFVADVGDAYETYQDSN